MKKEKIHIVKNVVISDDYLSMEIDNKNYKFLLKNISPALMNANQNEKKLLCK